MRDPVQDCITVMRTTIGHYIQDNQTRDETDVSCFQLRSYMRQGYDRNLAQSKLTLASNVDHTFDQINISYTREIVRIGREVTNESDRALLSYFEIMKDFARIKDCLDQAVIKENAQHSWRAGSGKLSSALQTCLRTFDTCWAQAKEHLWNMKGLHGKKFEHNEALKANVFARFESELTLNRGQFVNIMPKTIIESMETQNLTVPPAQEPPPYNAEHYVEIALVNPSGRGGSFRIKQ